MFQCTIKTNNYSMHYLCCIFIDIIHIFIIPNIHSTMLNMVECMFGTFILYAFKKCPLRLKIFVLN